MNYIPNYDLHNHTVFCDHADSDATVENLIERAEVLGLDYLGISEHVRFTEEFSVFEVLSEKLAGLEPAKASAKLFLGAEMDSDPVKMDGSFVADATVFDYVILSNHRLPETGIGVWCFHQQNYSPSQVERIGCLWLEWLDACMENSSFQILGHPLRFPIELGLFDIKQDKVFFKVIDVLKKLAVKNAAFEINNSFAATLKKKDYFDVYASLIGELKKYGVKFSRGSDSHSVKNLGKWDGGCLLGEQAGLDRADWLVPGWNSRYSG